MCFIFFNLQRFQTFMFSLCSLVTASAELRQAYKQFVVAVVELINDEVSSEEFRQVAKVVYDIFSGPEIYTDVSKLPPEKK